MDLGDLRPITVKVPADMIQAVDIYAVNHKLSRSEVVRLAIVKFLGEDYINKVKEEVENSQEATEPPRPVSYARYVCRLCGRAYKTKDSIKSHLHRVHHWSFEKGDSRELILRVRGQ